MIAIGPINMPKIKRITREIKINIGLLSLKLFGSKIMSSNRMFL